MAFEREGFQCVGFCGIDKHASKLYKAYYNTENEVYYNDATAVIPESMPDFDIFTGGFPCQAFSIAGKRQGFNDVRGTLFFEIARICEARKPKYIVLENVKGLLNHESGRTFSTIVGVLTDIGYTVEWQLLNSKFFEVPQNRERVFIVGYLRGGSGQKIFPIRETNTQNVKPIEKKREKIRLSQCLTTRSAKSRCGADYTWIIRQGGISEMTPLEWFRLQGFPDDMVQKAYEIGISDSQLYKMAGNSVTVNVVQEIAKRIKEEVKL